MFSYDKLQLTSAHKNSFYRTFNFISGHGGVCWAGDGSWNRSTAEIIFCYHSVIHWKFSIKEPNNNWNQPPCWYGDPIKFAKKWGTFRSLKDTQIVCHFLSNFVISKEKFVCKFNQNFRLVQSCTIIQLFCIMVYSDNCDRKKWLIERYKNSQVLSYWCPFQ